MKIMCIDGLDHRKVDQLNLKNLMLDKHGILEVPINEKVKQPLSPEVWRAFLTGEHKPCFFVSDHQTLFNILTWLRARIPIKVGLGTKLRVRGNMTYPPRDFGPTFIEQHRFTEITMPYYSLDFQKVTGKTNEFINGKISKQELQNFWLANSKATLLPALKAKGNSIAYFIELDAAQHVFPDTEYIDQLYQMFDDYARQYKPNLIISDHGSEKGMHSQVGFWATNLDIQPDKIVNLAKQIQGALE